MTTRECAQCGTRFDARRSDAKFCGPKCRQQNFQHALRRPGPATERESAVSATPGSQSEDGGLIAAVEAKLRAAGQMQTPDGQAALGIAEHLCRGTISGTERASLTKALHDAMARTLAAAPDPDDPVAAIRRRVEAKRQSMRPVKGTARNGRSVR
jgi:hypothetical protein